MEFILSVLTGGATGIIGSVIGKVFGFVDGYLEEKKKDNNNSQEGKSPKIIQFLMLRKFRQKELMSVLVYPLMQN